MSLKHPYHSLNDYPSIDLSIDAFFHLIDITGTAFNMQWVENVFEGAFLCIVFIG